MQCLYFSTSFRDNVINFPLPKPEPKDSIPPAASSDQQGDTAITSEGSNDLATSPSSKSALGLHKLAIPQKTNSNSSTASTSDPRGDQSKEAFDNRKKQLVANAPQIKLDSADCESYGMPESLFTGMKDIFEAVICHESRMGVVLPVKFLEFLRANNEVYSGTGHQDAHEFLNLLLNEVVEQVDNFTRKPTLVEDTLPLIDKDGQPNTALPSPNDTVNKPHQISASWVHELFEGTLTSETRCLTCENVSQRDEVFLDLSVDIEEHTSVTSSLRKFSEEEMLCEKNKFHCDRCGALQEAEKRMKIKRLPHILALHLKRFKYLEEERRMVKLFHRVVYPFHLRLLNTTDDAEDPDRLYELYAVIVHLGASPFHGHYVAIIKTREHGWLLFDDELVIPVDANYVRNYFGTGEQRNPACAYVLFYQKTTMEAVQREQKADNHTVDNLRIIPSDQVVSPTEHEDIVSPILEPEKRVQTPPQIENEITPSTKDISKSSNFSSNESSLQSNNEPTSAPNPRLVPAHHEGPAEHVGTRLSSEVPAAGTEEKPSGKESSRVSNMKQGLHRFRASSLSLRGAKPKLWGGKERDAKEPAEEADLNEVQASAGAEKGEKSEKQEKTKMGRFTLGRKKSTQML